MLGRLCPVASTARAPAGLLQLAPAFSVQNASVHHHRERPDLQRFLGLHRSNKAKANRNTHVNEKMFRRMRGRKTVLIDLPDDVEQRRLETLPPSQMRLEMLKKGINPYKQAAPRTWQEAQITMQTHHGVVDPFVSPEDPLPILSGGVDGLKLKGTETKERLLHKWHNWRNGVSRIRKKEGFEKFDPKAFGPQADYIYAQAHEALMARDKTTLHKYITENAFVKMWPDVEKGSVVWKLIEHVSPSQVVTIRCSDAPYKSGNDIAQLTVRMHTKQILAIYDRFGHLLLGSETEPQEIVEYAVFENHIAVVDGEWRLHDKVYPKWSQPKQGTISTQKLVSDDSSRPLEASSLPLRVEEKEKERREREKKGLKDDE